jgi:uncharacterized protein YciI
MPEDLAARLMEPVWLVEATYSPDAAETRVPIRPEHFARATELKAAGTIVEVGAFTDVSSAIIIVRAESEAAALEIVRADPYVTNGIWVELRAKAFNRLV